MCIRDSPQGIRCIPCLSVSSVIHQVVKGKQFQQAHYPKNINGAYFAVENGNMGARGISGKTTQYIMLYKKIVPNFFLWNRDRLKIEIVIFLRRCYFTWLPCIRKSFKSQLSKHIKSNQKPFQTRIRLHSSFGNKKHYNKMVPKCTFFAWFNWQLRKKRIKRITTKIYIRSFHLKYILHVSYSEKPFFGFLLSIVY